MATPLTWTRIKDLIDNNVARRFRVTQPDAKVRDGIIRQFTSQSVGRWGYCVVGDSIILGVEDPEDIEIVKRMFYPSRRRRPA